MKKLTGLCLAISFIIVLAACNQNENTTGNENNTLNDTNDVTNHEENANNDENANNGNDTTVNNSSVEEESNNEANNAATEEVDTIDNLTLYFSDDQLMHTYRVESGVSVAANEAGALEAMQLWAAGPTHEDLYPLLPAGTTVDSVEFNDDVAHVSFSVEINEANFGSGGEVMMTEQVAMMMEQFGYDETVILIDGQEPGEILSHMEYSEPIPANAPEDYEWID
ncbi:GerMN domain-containing protein [Salipaludibacillus agaradhaerens]|uniref:GerMN domain-containing protein n=1 Tax=Salipaludibacillus agaradhaerens TaxID=76935 RepID=UPI0021514AE9|nr:GerMN domain-containing protein [Salipaludibacillus agaradhaerens]MCR6105318.1 GerMN domain-containing protein [Salipaludibacillus agaradhaerens]MCR6117359.1 GerMN domain-containing protein [Salipaludibacillus agaradhaerens]UJW56555.1 GerMN domain-containing protein [Bacillus sp. A116_S68]